jgi:pimeloyl-ACP methyl ester carboxylesterase
MKNKILVVRGFDTDNIKTNDTYANIHIVLSQNVNNDMTYFSYSQDENIVNVYKRLCKVLKDNVFTHIIGHSMGCGLLMKYMYDHPDDISNYKHIILLMPLLYKTPFNRFIFRFRLVRNISLPNAVILPSARIYSTGNILNDGFKFSKMKQLVDVYDKIMLEADESVDVLNRNKTNTVVFYAREERITPIPQRVLKKIKNKKYVNGLHESFNSLETVKEFFEKLLPYFE